MLQSTSKINVDFDCDLIENFNHIIVSWQNSIQSIDVQINSVKKNIIRKNYFQLTKRILNQKNTVRFQHKNHNQARFRQNASFNRSNWTLSCIFSSYLYDYHYENFEHWFRNDTADDVQNHQRFDRFQRIDVHVVRVWCLFSYDRIKCIFFYFDATSSSDAQNHEWN